LLCLAYVRHINDRTIFLISGLVTDSMLGFKRDMPSGLSDIVTHFATKRGLEATETAEAAESTASQN